MFASNVQPRKRPLKDRYVYDWACHCTPPLSLSRTMHPSYITRCPKCGERRP